MDRRAFVVFVTSGLAATATTALAQQARMPIVGLLHSGSAPYAGAFQTGLAESGFSANKNVLIEQRYAKNQIDKLPALAAELVRRQAAVIVCNGIAVKTAMAATSSIPIVFITGSDPVDEGLIASLARPDGNVTGVTFFGGEQLIAKRIELLNELIPGARPLAVLIDPNNIGGDRASANAAAAGRLLKREVIIVKTESGSEVEPAFHKIVQSGAVGLVVGGSAFFTDKQKDLIALSSKHRIPTIYTSRGFVAAGGLISYSGNIADAYRLAGVYAGRILKGAKPGELPVQQPTTIEMVINLKAAKALGVKIPQTILVRADEVMQ